MVLSVVEAEPMCSKPPAGVSTRISTGERRGFDASALLSIRASSPHIVKAEGT